MAINLKNTKSMQAIAGISKKGVEESNKKIIKDIPLELIDPHPINSTIYTLNNIEGLMQSITRSGFIGAIDVYIKGDGRYLIGSGHRRFEAMKRLGKKTIPCILYEMEDEHIIVRKLIEANQNTRIDSPIETANAVLAYEKSLYESGFKGSIIDELSAVFNLSSFKIQKLKNITKLTDTLKKYAYDVSFPYEAFNDAVNFTKEQQTRLSEKIENHFALHPDAELTSMLAKQFIEQIKTEIKIEKANKEREEIIKQAELLNKQKEEEEKKKREMEPASSASDLKDNNKPDNIEVSTPQNNTHDSSEPAKESDISKSISYANVVPSVNTHDTIISIPEKENNDIITYEDEKRPILELRKEENVDIDYDLESYTARLHSLLSNPNTIVSNSTKEKTLVILNDIIHILNQK